MLGLTKTQNFITFSLGIIFVFSFLVRTWGLEQNPAGFFADEAASGYNAYTIWNSGTDEYRNAFPLFFRSFGDYKDPVYIYSMTPIIGIFGLREFSVRFTSALYGTLAVVAIFLLSRKLFNSKVALISGLFLAISQWHIHFSRVGFQVIASVFWIPVAIFLLIKSFKNFKYYPFFLISIIFSYFTYYTPKIYLPFVVFSVFIIYWRSSREIFKKKSFWICSFIALTIFITLIKNSLIDGTFFARWNQVDESLTFDKILTGYLNHFSYKFLFSSGDIGFPGQFITRHSIRGIGQLYLFQLPLLIFAFIKSFKDKANKESLIFIFFWILFIYPLGSIFVSENPQASRSIIGVVPFQILSAYGLIQIFNLTKSKTSKLTISLITIIIIAISFLQFTKKLNNYPQYSSDYWGWQYGPEKIIGYFLKNKDSYSQMCMENRFNAPYIFLKFYDPENSCNGECQICDTTVYNSSKSQLFAISNETYLEIKSDDSRLFNEKSKIHYPNGDAAFYIGELKEK